jgi:hypothetical protein
MVAQSSAILSLTRSFVRQFAKEMNSPNLKKVNKSFDVKVECPEDSPVAKLRAEFIDGSVWETPSKFLS